jgi:hypothetical protein
MFGLLHRGELPATTENELEHLTTRLKSLWLVEHNEDGTHHTDLFAAVDHTHEASDIISGTLDASQIPSLDASKITTGAFAKARQNSQTAYKDEANTFALSQALTLGFTERGRTDKAGEWADDSLTLGSSAGTFTGTKVTFRHTLIGKTMWLSYVVSPGNLATAAAATLTIAIPGGHTANVRMDNPPSVSIEGGTQVPTYAFVSAGGTVINFQKADGVDWAVGAIALSGQIFFEIQ